MKGGTQIAWHIRQHDNSLCAPYALCVYLLTYLWCALCLIVWIDLVVWFTYGLSFTDVCCVSTTQLLAVADLVG